MTTLDFSWTKGFLVVKKNGQLIWFSVWLSIHSSSVNYTLGTKQTSTFILLLGFVDKNQWQHSQMIMGKLHLFKCYVTLLFWFSGSGMAFTAEGIHTEDPQLLEFHQNINGTTVNICMNMMRRLGRELQSTDPPATFNMKD